MTERQSQPLLAVGMAVVALCVWRYAETHPPASNAMFATIGPTLFAIVLGLAAWRVFRGLPLPFIGASVYSTARRVAAACLAGGAGLAHWYGVAHPPADGAMFASIGPTLVALALLVIAWRVLRGLALPLSASARKLSPKRATGLVAAVIALLVLRYVASHPPADDGLGATTVPTLVALGLLWVAWQLYRHEALPLRAVLSRATASQRRGALLALIGAIVLGQSIRTAAPGGDLFGTVLPAWLAVAAIVFGVSRWRRHTFQSTGAQPA
ncbi:MAG: hypothetical protein U0610_07075 [bacterium]